MKIAENRSLACKIDKWRREWESNPRFTVVVLNSNSQLAAVRLGARMHLSRFHSLSGWVKDLVAVSKMPFALCFRHKLGSITLSNAKSAQRGCERTNLSPPVLFLGPLAIGRTPSSALAATPVFG